MFSGVPSSKVFFFSFMMTCLTKMDFNMFLFFLSLFEQVDGMDALAVKQACKFAKEHVLRNGPIVSFTLCKCVL